MKHSKSLLLILLMTLSSILCAAVPETTKALRVISQNQNEIRMKLSIPTLDIKPAELATTDFQELNLEGFAQTAETGKAQLPFISTTLAIPANGNFHVQVIERAQKSIAGIVLKPVFATDSAREAVEYDHAFYQSEGFYPRQIMEHTNPVIIRDFRVVTISIYPVRWNPATQELCYTEDLDLVISFDGSPSENEMAAYSGYSKTFEKVYEGLIDNFDYYRTTDDTPQTPKVLLIYGNSTDQTYLSKVTELADWKRQKGFDVFSVSTSTTGSSNTAIKNYIQARYDNLDTRPDFIILLGDVGGSYSIPAWIENVSGYSGEGDYPYTFLAGSDLLGDAYIGRISATNLSELQTLLNKIYTYEKNINNDPVAAAWLNRMLLVGDPSSSGVSTIYTNKFIKELAHQVHPEYNFIEAYSGNYASAINAGINQGVALFNYRGYISMSSWSPSSSLINGFKLPHAVILTCGTGSYSGTSTSESFIRLGTAVDPKGALTAIGMATSGTHTMFNNTLSGGIFDGILRHKQRTMGEALLNGRLFLNHIYAASNPSQTQYFAHWCNLMGDPTVEVFIGIPQNFTVLAPQTIPAGTPLVDISVIDSQSLPIKHASVTIYQNSISSIIARAYTNEDGMATLSLPATASGQLLVTVAKHDFKPTQFQIDVDTAGALVFNHLDVLDDGSSGSIGNDNGMANATEVIAMKVSVKNTTAMSHNGLNGILSTTDPYVTITQSQSSFNSINPGEVVSSTSYFLFSIASNLPPQHDIRFNLTITDDLANTFEAIFHLPSFNAELVVSQISFSDGGNNVLDPSETGSLSVLIHNQAMCAIDNIQAELTALNDLIQITDNQATYGYIPASGIVNTTDNFTIFARPQLIAGMQIPMRIRLFNQDGFEQYHNFNIPVGTVSVNTPLGPDSYGYLIYGIEDVGYPEAPVYEWIEIHPNQGGAGTLLNLNDAGTSNDEGDQIGSIVTAVVDLPFTFPFYGIDYNQITVCVNGFIAMGVSENGDFRNYRLPGAMGASPMIAAFWDDLILISDAGVYKYYDLPNHRFIVQYHKMRNGYDRTSEETFQVIFYDPMYYPTGMEDGMIKIQYKVFNNVDYGSGGYTPYHGNYCTIGIKDHTGSQGLEYTYNNTYPQAASPLSNQKALLITTVPVLHQNPYLVISETITIDENGNEVPEPGEMVELGVKLINLGINTAYNVQMTAAINNQYATLVNPTTSYQPIEGSGYGVNQTPIRIQISEDCPDNTVIQIVYNISILGNSWQYPVSMTVRKPNIIVNSLLINDILGNGNGVVEPGETFKLIVNYENTSIAPAKNMSSNIFCSDNRVTIYNPQQLLYDIPPDTKVQAVYEVSFNNEIELGTFVTFYLTYLGDFVPPQNQNISVSCGITGVNDSFEENNGDYIPTPANNGWEWGTSNYAGAHSGSRVWGTRLNEAYSNNTTYALVSPQIFLGQNYGLEFWHRYDTEENYDGGNVKISTNNGSSWTLIYPEGGYNSTNVSALGEAGWTGTSTNWSVARFNLSEYSNQNVKFKWTLKSDNTYNGQGWFIDDVSTTGFISFGGMVGGTVVSSNPDPEFEDILVKSASGLGVHPNEQGIYELYLPSGGHYLTASGTGYLTDTSTGFYISIANPIISRDFYLSWLNPASDLSYSFNESQLLLSWNPPVEPLFTPQGFQVYKKMNAGKFEQIAETQESFYTEAIADSGSYQYYIKTYYAEGESDVSNVVAFEYPHVSTSDSGITPYITKLYNAYPNPFNPSTMIKYSLSAPAKVKLSIYNLRGQKVKTLVEDMMPAGIHEVQWNGTDSSNRQTASGVYLFRLETPACSLTKKAILMK